MKWMKRISRQYKILNPIKKEKILNMSLSRLGRLYLISEKVQIPISPLKVVQPNLGPMVKGNLILLQSPKRIEVLSIMILKIVTRISRISIMETN